MHLRRALLVTVLTLGACEPAAKPAQEPSRGADPAPAAVSPTTKPHNMVSCEWPVDGNKDNAASVLKRFGKDARRATLGGPEGAEFEGLVLWEGDPARRIEVLLDDESANERIFGIRLYEATSRWRIAGLGIGDPLDRVIAANGRPFVLYGFGWDYGGYLSDLKGGKLDSLPGGCEMGLRLDLVDVIDEASAGILGNVQLESDDPRLSNRRITVSELSLNWR